MFARKIRTCTFGFILITAVLLMPGWCQKITKVERDRAQSMLLNIAADVKKHYYDPKLHGLDFDNKVREMKQKIDQVETSDRALSEVAALLDLLNDSHTYFLPPRHIYRHDYGWEAQIIGDRCYVVRVRPGSDAEAKGLKPGDEVLAINGFDATKDNLQKMEYVFNSLRPQPGLHLDLRDPAGKERAIDIATKFTATKTIKDLTGPYDFQQLVLEEENERHRGRPRTVEMGDELMVVKFPGFFFTELELDSMIGKARKHKALILDLRGNGGGSVDTFEYLLGGMFDKQVKIGDRVGRSEHKPMVAKARGHSFEGKLVVLIDSKSASASELFARIIQIEKRGIVLGDLSSGRVMEAKLYSHQDGVGTVVFYGASITEADIIMTDGKSLEHSGVAPDEVVLPTAADLANNRDPVLARAAETLGAKISPEDAGKMFPYEWPSQ
jgi:C-terminal processing protease CtpA/Prc